MRVLWAYCVRTMGVLWACYRRIMGILWAYYGRIMGVLWAYYGRIMGLLWACYVYFNFLIQGFSLQSSMASLESLSMTAIFEFSDTQVIYYGFVNVYFFDFWYGTNIRFKTRIIPSK